MSKWFVTLVALFVSAGTAQDAVTFPWPFPPFGQSQLITGTFCEFRNTLTSNHFHNGTDIPEPDGSNVYAVLDGTVYTLGTPETDGTSAYVRVKTNVNGQWKHISYVHIQPNPALAPGSPVTAGVTVLGTILSGLGHTHLTERQLVSSENSSGVEIGALREPGGLTPYVDTYSPKVLWVKFFQDNSSVEFTAKKVFGRTDIISQMVERNTDGTPNSGSTTNNGVYHTGYRILSADRSTVVYDPPGNGVRYKFDYKPNDAQSNVAYTLESTTSQHIYILTNGTGNIGIGTSSTYRTIVNNYFDASLYPAGQYQVMVYALDTHGNADTVYVPFEISSQDVVPPAAPKLRSVRNDAVNQVTVAWYPNTEPDLKGYRLYSSVNGTAWTLQRDEATLTPGVTSLSFTGISSQTPVFFRMTAVDSAALTNVSGYSDTYALRPNAPGGTVLIVDGFDRTSGSYSLPSHPFAATAGQSVNARYETAHNSAVTDGSVPLAPYQAVVWNFGDESSTNETFGTAEQAKAAAYLQQGGKLFVTGSEVAYDLDRTSGPSVAARAFFNDFLKADYAGDASGSYTVNGAAGTILDGLSFAYGDTLLGAPYREDYPDHVNAFGGSAVIAKYANGLNAATMFAGTFPSGSAPGSVVFLGIPFETIHTKANRDALMTRVLNHFGIVTSAPRTEQELLPAGFALAQNYPNPFNPSTTVRFSLPSEERITLAVFDVMGREVGRLAEGRYAAGEHSVAWDASGFASGIYLCRLTAGPVLLSRKMTLMK